MGDEERYKGANLPAGEAGVQRFRALRLVKIWLMISSRAAQAQLLTNWAGLLFIVGKVIRFLMFFIFLFVVLSSTKTLAGYNREQVILFFLVFNLVDILVQFLFRGVYQFRSLVVNGEYDLDLVKPLPSFFRPIFGWTDILDGITLIPLCLYFAWFIFEHQLFRGWVDVALFCLLLVNSLVLAFAFHLFVCAVCVLTTEVDHLIWVYRDLTNMARFPTDIYQKGVRYFLTFTIPVVIMITIPSKALLGALPWYWIILSLLAGGLFLWGSLKFWRYALSQYSSASS
jgi:ABC-2 type transport system permease protein